MKRSLTILTIGALGILLAGCMDDSGGGGSGASPSPEPEPTRHLVESRWLGTAPFCDAHRNDCRALGNDWEYVESDISGDGASCSTGRKVLCSRFEWR